VPRNPDECQRLSAPRPANVADDLITPERKKAVPPLVAPGRNQAPHIPRAFTLHFLSPASAATFALLFCWTPQYLANVKTDTDAIAFGPVAVRHIRFNLVCQPCGKQD